MQLLRTSAIQLSLRAATAAALAFWIATLLGAHYAIYALVAGIIVTDLSPKTSRRLAIQRMGGTVIGALAGALFVQLLPSGPIALGVAILVSMATAYACRFETPAARVAGYVCAIAMFAHRGDIWMYAFDRAWETIVGIGAALLVGLVPLWMRGDSDPPRT